MDAKLQEKKIELIQWLSTLDDIAILKKIMELREGEKTNCWDELSTDEKKSIEKGIKDVDSGNLKPHAHARKTYEKWL